MAQQINLCTGGFQLKRQPFDARLMMRALGALILFGGAALAYWAQHLDRANRGLEQTVAQHQREADGLKKDIQAAKAAAGPPDAALVQEVQTRRAELQKRQQLLIEMRRGLVQDGRGHAARLQLVAQTIPAQVWVTEVKADEDRLEISGLTLEPAALNDWLQRLGGNPLLQGQRLAAVKVDQVGAAPRPGQAVPALSQTRATSSTPAWTFTLLSAASTTATPVLTSTSTATGGRP